MPSCVVQWCKSNSSDHHKATGITFHTFPKDVCRRDRWVNAVQLERQEKLWCPGRGSTICSIHFCEDDFYFAKTGTYQMLKKTAVPVCTMVGYAQVAPGTNNDSSGNNFQEKESPVPYYGVMPTSAKCQPIPVKTEPICDPENKTEAVCDTPRTIQQLERRLLQETKARNKLMEKLKRVQKKNQHLQRKCNSYKDMVNTLSKLFGLDYDRGYKKQIPNTTIIK